jgi:hypothetical protein
MTYRIKATFPGGEEEELTSEWFSNIADACTAFASMLPKDTQLLTAFALGIMVGSEEDSDTFGISTITIEERPQ